MAFPTVPTIDYSYTAFQQAQGKNDFPGTQLDNDLANLVDALAEVREFVEGSFRSDGGLLPGALPTEADLTAYGNDLADVLAQAVAARDAAVAAAAEAEATVGGKADVATTLAGYGITDAAPIAHVGSGGSAHALATTDVHGFMASTDKVKLNGLGDGAAVVSVAGRAGVVSLTKGDVGLGNVTNEAQAPLTHVGAGGAAHAAATSSASGFMTASDRLIMAALDVATPAQHGFVSGLDATTALNAMFASGASRFIVDSNETYIVTGQVVLPAVAEIIGRLNISVQATSPVATRPLLVLGSFTKADSINITVESGYTWLRPITFGSDVDIRSLIVTAVTQQAGYTDASPSALMMENVSRIHIGYLYIEKFDRCIWIRNADTVRIGTLRMLTCYRGLQAAGRAAENWGCRRLEIGFVDCHGDSPNKTTDPGNNALALGSVDECAIGTSYIYDTGEHGIRIFGENIDTTVIPTYRFRFGSVYIYRPGRCGFKASSGTSNDDGASAKIYYLDINHLYVEDAGYAEDALSAATHRTNNNDFGLFLDRVDTAFVGRYQTYKVANTNYNGIHNLNLRNCRRVTVDNVDMHGSMDSALSLQNTDVDGEDIRVNGDIVDFGLSGQSADAAIEVYLSSGTFRRVTCDVNIRNGINGVTMAGLSGSLAAAFLVRGTHEGLSGSVIVSNPGGNFRNHLRAVSYVPSGYTISGSSTTTDYAFGTLITVDIGTGAAPSIATLKTIHLASGDTTRFVTSDSGVTLGTALAGTWRCRGKISSTIYLFQRVDM